MKLTAQTVLITLAFFVAGCAAPTANQTANSSAASRLVGTAAPGPVAEGTITSPIAVEEGFLRLDLSDGTRMEFLTDESVASMDSLLRAAGRKCRVYYQDGWYEDIEGDRSPALQMTKIEWL